MKIELFHTAYEPEPVLVATLERPDVTETAQIVRVLDEMYRATQNVRQNWVQDRGQFGIRIEPTAVQIHKGGCRSTSIRDYALVHVGERVLRFDVAPVGWKPIDQTAPHSA